MFRAVDLFLLLMAAGIVWLGVEGLRARRPLRRLLSPHAPERLLFGSWGERLRISLAVPAVLLALCCVELEIALFHSQLAVHAPALCAGGEQVLDLVLCCAVAVKIFGCTRYNLWQLGAGFCCYFILRWVYLNSQHIFFILAVFLIMAAKDVPLEPMMKAFLAAGGAAVGFVMLCSLGGWLDFSKNWFIHLEYEGYAPYDHEILTFGYTHYNTLGGLLLGLTFAWVLLRSRRFGWTDCVPVAVSAGFLLLVADSSASGLTALALLACCVLVKLAPRAANSRAVCLLGTAAPVLLAIGNYLLIFLMWRARVLGADPPGWLARLNELMTNRLEISALALTENSVRIAGQMLDTWYAIDNYYLYSMLTLGPVVFALLLGGACVTVYRLFRAHQPLMALAVLCGCGYASFEIQFIHLSANPTLVLYTLAFYGGAALLPAGAQKKEGPR